MRRLPFIWHALRCPPPDGCGLLLPTVFVRRGQGATPASRQVQQKGHRPSPAKNARAIRSAIAALEKIIGSR